MDAVTVDDVLKLATNISTVAPVTVMLLTAVGIIYAFHKRWLVVGSFYSDLEIRLSKTETQRDQALELAEKLTGILESGRRGSFRR